MAVSFSATLDREELILPGLATIENLTFSLAIQPMDCHVAASQLLAMTGESPRQQIYSSSSSSAQGSCGQISSAH